MPLGNTQSNSENIFWQTPKSGLLGRSIYRLGPCTITDLVKKFKLERDVCAEDSLQSCCHLFYTKDQTYKRPWNKNWFMNPPWKTEILEPMLRRAIGQTLKWHNIGVCLLPAYLGAPWFHDLVLEAGASILPIAGRVKYWKDNAPHPGSPNIDSMLVIYSYGRM